MTEDVAKYRKGAVRTFRVTLILDMDAGFMDDKGVEVFLKSPEGAHYALDHGQLVSVNVEKAP